MQMWQFCVENEHYSVCQLLREMLSEFEYLYFSVFLFMTLEAYAHLSTTYLTLRTAKRLLEASDKDGKR